ncbi:l-Fucosyltransferase [Trichonephila clavipes]|nr:l-Fucosyltransferase [Trichonephila clavipes]
MFRPVDQRDAIYRSTRLRKPLTKQSSRRLPHRVHVSSLTIRKRLPERHHHGVNYVCVPSRPPIDISVCSGAVHEETGQQRNGTRLCLAANPDSISAVMYTVTPSIDPWHEMTAQRYVHDILQTHVLPLMQRLPGPIFKQDNARPHTTKVLQNCFRTVTILP